MNGLPKNTLQKIAKTLSEIPILREFWIQKKDEIVFDFSYENIAKWYGTGSIGFQSLIEKSLIFEIPLHPETKNIRCARIFNTQVHKDEYYKSTTSKEDIAEKYLHYLEYQETEEYSLVYQEEVIMNGLKKASTKYSSTFSILSDSLLSTLSEKDITEFYNHSNIVLTLFRLEYQGYIVIKDCTIYYDKESRQLSILLSIKDKLLPVKVDIADNIEKSTTIIESIPVHLSIMQAENEITINSKQIGLSYEQRTIFKYIDINYLKDGTTLSYECIAKKMDRNFDGLPDKEKARIIKRITNAIDTLSRKITKQLKLDSPLQRKDGVLLLNDSYHTI